MVDLADFLKGMGARIDGGGNRISSPSEGVPSLHPATYRVMPDRIEAGTYLVAAGITGGEITLTDYDGSCLEALIMKLQETGLEFAQDKTGLTVPDPENSKRLCYHPALSRLSHRHAGPVHGPMCVGQDTSIIPETIFENRFMHVSELRRMGADIQVCRPPGRGQGRPRLIGRAGHGHRPAGQRLPGPWRVCAAEGTTEITRVYHLDRGYETLEKKLSALGAKIERIKETG